MMIRKILYPDTPQLIRLTCVLVCFCTSLTTYAGKCFVNGSFNLVDVYTSATGSDTDPGKALAPFLTIDKLITSTGGNYIVR